MPPPPRPFVTAISPHVVCTSHNATAKWTNSSTRSRHRRAGLLRYIRKTLHHSPNKAPTFLQREKHPRCINYVWARRGNIGGSLGAKRHQQFRGQQQQLQHPFQATVTRNGSKTCAKRRVVARHVFILVFKEQMWSSPPTSRRNKCGLLAHSEAATQLCHHFHARCSGAVGRPSRSCSFSPCCITPNRASTFVKTKTVSARADPFSARTLFEAWFRT